MELIKNISKQKLRGGFYTPNEIASFIIRWALNENPKSDILEPSCGDGVFLKELSKSKLKYNSITAIEINKEEAEKAKKARLKNKLVFNEDFFEFCNLTKKRFNLIIGNPPYIRYQYISKEQKTKAEKIFSRAGLKYSRLTNTWVAFVVGASLLLKEKGKIGFVLPAEILQVSYAKQLRTFLAHYYNKINIISFKKLVFPKVQQEVILLLCEKNNANSHLIEHLELENTEGLNTLDISRLKSPKKKIDFKSNKWTFYFLSQNEIDFLERLLNQNLIPQFKKYASAEVGITTGNNNFFTVPLSTVRKYRLDKFAKPMVGRSVQVRSLRFAHRDWKENVQKNVRAYFVIFPALTKLQKHKGAMNYIALGEKEKVDRGYKCRIRDEWQIVPSARISDALFIRRNNIYPKLILNEAKAYTTDTMHRITIKKGLNRKAFIASYYNSLSLASAEICGRSHGGGVLELMPSEVGNALLPYRRENEKLFYKIDEMMRNHKMIDEILRLTDSKILKYGYKFTESEIILANRIWKKLLSRRLGRK